MGNAIYRKDADGMTRVRNARHKDSTFTRDRALRHLIIGAGGFPAWVNYPPSPVAVESYPYQFIFKDGSVGTYLVTSNDEIKAFQSGGFATVNTQNMTIYILNESVWAEFAITTGVAVDNPLGIESVYDIYIFESGVLWTAKTLSPTTSARKRVNL